MKILSIDGGGVRGIIPARILQAVEEAAEKPICELFDVITGTSTGGLISLALTTPKPEDKNKPKYSAKYLVDFYKNNSSKIFPPCKHLGSMRLSFRQGFFRSMYPREPYDKILKEEFGDTLLSQTLCPVFIPIYSLGTNKTLTASTLKARVNEDDDFYIRDVAAATSAAPTYFDPKPFKSFSQKFEFKGVDGGIYANNPELIGAMAAYQMNPADFSKKNVLLLSLGTGKVAEADKDDSSTSARWRTNKGIFNNGVIGALASGLIDSMMNADGLVAEEAVSTVLKDSNNFRFQVDLEDEKQAKMDDSSEGNIAALEAIAEEYVRKNEVTIKNLCNRLKV